MPIPIACRCGMAFSAQDHLAGQVVSCSNCGQPLQIPMPAAPAPMPNAPVAPYQPMPGATPQKRGSVGIIIGFSVGGVVLLALLVMIVASLGSKENGKPNGPRRVANNGNNNRPTPIPNQRPNTSFNDNSASQPRTIPVRPSNGLSSTSQSANQVLPTSDLWNARPDPAATFALAEITNVKNRPVPAVTQPVYPDMPSPFVLLPNQGQGISGGTVGAMQPEDPIIDLRTMKTVGGIGYASRKKVMSDSPSLFFEALSSDGQHFAIGSTNKVHLWITNSDNPAVLEMTRGDSIRSITFARNDRVVAASEPNVAIIRDRPRPRLDLGVWNCETNREVLQRRYETSNKNEHLQTSSLITSPGGRYAMAVLGKCVYAFDLQSGKCVGRVTLPGINEERANVAWCGWAFSPDAGRVAALFRNTSARMIQLAVIDFASGTVLVERNYGDDPLGRIQQGGITMRGLGVQWIGESDVLALRGYLLVDARSGDPVGVFPTRPAFPRLMLDVDSALVRVNKDNLPSDYYFSEVSLDDTKSNLAEVRAGRTPTIAIKSVDATPRGYRHDSPGVPMPDDHPASLTIGAPLVPPDPSASIKSLRMLHAIPHECRSRHSIGLAISPDGKTAVTGWGELIMWDVESGTPRRTLPLAANVKVQAIAFFPDGTRFATALFRETIIWDAATGDKLKTLPAAGKAIAVSPEGKRIATGEITIFDAAMGESDGQIVAQSGAVLALVFSPDGRMFASAHENKTVRLWEVNSMDGLNTFRGHEDRVNAITFSPDGQTLATGSADKQLKFWDVKSAAVRAEGNYPPIVKEYTRFAVHDIVFSRDGKTAVVGRMDGLALYDAASGLEREHSTELRVEGKFLSSDVRTVAISANGQVIAAVTPDVLLLLQGVK